MKCRRLRWAGHVVRMEEGRSAFKILTGKLTGKRNLGRPRYRWEENIRLDLKEIGIKKRNFNDLAQDRTLLESPCEFHKPWSLFSYMNYTLPFCSVI